MNEEKLLLKRDHQRAPKPMYGIELRKSLHAFTKRAKDFKASSDSVA
jgi:hypothetical protein